MGEIRLNRPRGRFSEKEQQQKTEQHKKISDNNNRNYLKIYELFSKIQIFKIIYESLDDASYTRCRKILKLTTNLKRKLGQFSSSMH